MAKSKSALGARFRHIARRKSGKIAVFATARRLAVLIYRLLRYGQPYHDIGAKAAEEHFAARRLDALTKSAQTFGYRLIPMPSAG